MTYKAFAAQRKALRVSQGRIARLVGLSQPMISQFELGNISLRPEQLERLEEALRQEVAATARNAEKISQFLGCASN